MLHLCLYVKDVCSHGRFDTKSLFPLQNAIYGHVRTHSTVQVLFASAYVANTKHTCFDHFSRVYYLELIVQEVTLGRAMTQVWRGPFDSRAKITVRTSDA